MFSEDILARATVETTLKTLTVAVATKADLFPTHAHLSAAKV